MDTSLYFIRCKGEEKGPYAFYQIQQMRTNDVFVPANFTPDEWAQLEEFLDDGDIPRPRDGGAPAIRRQEDAATKKQTERSLSVWLTYLSYAIGGFFVMAALILGNQDYIMQARPMFWLGMYFSAALCHTAVDRFCRRQLTRYPKSSRLDLFVKYFVALLLFVAACGALYGAGKFLKSSLLDPEHIRSTGTKYLICAAIVALYRPFYLSFMATHEFLKPRGKASLPWMAVLVGFVVLLTLYLAPTAGLSHPIVDSVRQPLFASDSAATGESLSEWKFPIQLGDTQKAVQRIFGKPQIVGRDYVYHSLRVSFDQQLHVTRLHFDGRELPKSLFAKKQVFGGVTPMASLKELKGYLGEKHVTFGDDISETHVWEMPGYRVAAAFWNKDTATGKANAVKWLEISATQ